MSQDNDNSPHASEPLPLPRGADMGFGTWKYPDFGAYVRHLQSLREAHPEQFAFHTDRRTCGGDYDLYWLTVGDVRKPAVLVVSCLHAKNEWAAASVTMRFVEALLSEDHPRREFHRAFLDRACLVAVPVVNIWGYFACPEGKHYNKHPAPVADIEKVDWHDTTHYRTYSGVNLNRNFDWNWQAYPNLPFSVRSFWNGRDYGRANYFMMPFYVDDRGREVYDPENTHPDHILKPDPDIYDYKGEAPMSEPETQLIGDLFGRYDVAGFVDWHVMNPWQTHNVSYIPDGPDRGRMVKLVDDGIAAVNARHRGADAKLPATDHIVAEDYDDGAPYAINWAHQRMKVKAFAWETGTHFPDELWTDAYMEMFYRGLYWMLT